jgi:hypothetical protein
LTSATNFSSGQYIVVAGENSPQRVLSKAVETLTVNRAFRNGAANGAVVTPVATGTINQSSPMAAGDTTISVANGYPSGYMLEINVNGTGVPKTGQLVAFKTAGGTVYTPEYAIVRATDIGGGTYAILLDRPLENTVAHSDIVCYGPAGDYNFCLQRNAVAFVNRPLAPIDPSTGVRSAIGYANNVALRVVFAYDSKKEAMRCTIAGLFGVAKLDSALGGVLLG